MSASQFRAIQKEVIACKKCRELRSYCSRIAQQKKRAHRDATYWAKPVPAFGVPRARLLLVGLAPGAHGSNRTGRPFTGDASGDFLYPALYRAGFANQSHSISASDGMRLRDCMITAALRCAPPHNKPTPPQLRRCHPYLLREVEALTNLRVVIGLGSIGTAAAIHALRDAGFACDIKGWKFAHGAELRWKNSKRTITLIASFHPSRQNTNTGKLTMPMFDGIFSRTNELLTGP